MAAWRYEISLLVLKKIFHSFTAFTREIFFNTQRKILYPVWPCNILYIHWLSIREINKYCVIHWIGIYPEDTIIHHLNNWSLKGIR